MDQIYDWLPALTTTSILGGAAWLARSLIATWLTNSVKSEFDSKLEILRSELKSKETQNETLHSGAMSGLITRQGALYQRKLEAIDQIWSAVKELDKAKHISLNMSILKFEACAETSANEPKFREFIATIGGNFDLGTLNLSGAIIARPFLTRLAWAYYSAFSAIITFAVTKMKILKIGVGDPAIYLNSEYPKKLLKTVLPSRTEYIDNNDHSVHHYLLDEIEQLLLLELKNIQDGKEADSENVQRAAEITKDVGKFKIEMSKRQTDA